MVPERAQRLCDLHHGMLGRVQRLGNPLGRIEGVNGAGRTPALRGRCRGSVIRRRRLARIGSTLGRVERRAPDPVVCEGSVQDRADRTPTRSGSSPVLRAGRPQRVPLQRSSTNACRQRRRAVRTGALFLCHNARPLVRHASAARPAAAGAPTSVTANMMPGS